MPARRAPYVRRLFRTIADRYDLITRRVMRAGLPGGLFLSLDFNRPENRLVRGVYHGYLTVIGSAL